MSLSLSLFLSLSPSSSVVSDGEERGREGGRERERNRKGERKTDREREGGRESEREMDRAVVGRTRRRGRGDIVAFASAPAMRETSCILKRRERREETGRRERKEETASESKPLRWLLEVGDFSFKKELERNISLFFCGRYDNERRCGGEREDGELRRIFFMTKRREIIEKEEN
jgi:hypothetical protein